MKSLFIRIAIVTAVAFAMPAQSDAQILDILKGAAGAVMGGKVDGNEAVGTITNVVGNILGNGKVKESSLEGTWTYTEPCVVFESDDVLSKIGGGVAQTKIESKFDKALSKIGISKGKVIYKFNADKTMQITVGKKTFDGTYSVEGNDLTMVINNRTINANVKLSLGTLQISMKADKLLTFAQTVSTKLSSVASSAGTIAAVLGAYKGMYIGMKFTK